MKRDFLLDQGEFSTVRSERVVFARSATSGRSESVSHCKKWMVYSKSSLIIKGSCLKGESFSHLLKPFLLDELLFQVLLYICLLLCFEDKVILLIYRSLYGALDTHVPPHNKSGIRRA